MSQRITTVMSFLILWGVILFMKFYASEKSDFLFAVENNISANTKPDIFLKSGAFFSVLPPSHPPVPKLFRGQLLVN